MNLEYNHDAWSSEELSGIYFRMLGNGNALFIGNISDMLAGKELIGYGDRPREEKILYWSEYLSSTICIWAIYELSQDFENTIGKLRDEYGNVKIDDVKMGSSKLIELDRRLLDLQRDSIPFATELSSFCKYKSWFMHNVYELFPVGDYGRDSGLFDGIRKNLIDKSNFIINGESQLMSVSERIGRYISTITSEKLTQINLRIQKGVYWMTFVLVILTIVLVWSEIIN